RATPPALSYLPSLHDALPISSEPSSSTVKAPGTELGDGEGEREVKIEVGDGLGSWITWPVASSAVCAAGTKYAKPPATDDIAMADRKSTRLNSSHVAISYAVF